MSEEKAIEGSGEDGKGVMLRYEPSLDLNEPEFHPPPQAPKLPPKDKPKAGGRFAQEV